MTLGIFVGYVVGKPVGMVGASWLPSRRRLGGLRLPVGLSPLVGTSAVAGIGFTVALLIATLAFEGAELQEAKLGILGAAVAASVLGALVFRALVFRALDRLAPIERVRRYQDTPGSAPRPRLCGQAEPVLRDLLAESGDDLRYVFRHLPLIDVHPRSQTAAEAAEAAAAHGRFWEMHDHLFARQEALRLSELVAYAEQLGLDSERVIDEIRKHIRTAVARGVRPGRARPCARCTAP